MLSKNLLPLLLLFMFSCTENVSEKNHLEEASYKLQNEKAFKETIEKHLNAVTNRDLTTLKSTMSPQRITTHLS